MNLVIFQHDFSNILLEPIKNIKMDKNSSKRRFNDKIDIGLGHRVVAYEAPNGAEIPILIDSNLKQESGKDLMLFADSSTIEVKRLLAPTLMTNLPTNKLGTKNAVVSFATANITAEFCNGMIKGIDTSLEVKYPWNNAAAATGSP